MNALPPYDELHQISEDELLTLRRFGSSLEGHPTSRFAFADAAAEASRSGNSVVSPMVAWTGRCNAGRMATRQ